jgi:hypothetical protein
MRNPSILRQVRRGRSLGSTLRSEVKEVAPEAIKPKIERTIEDQKNKLIRASKIQKIAETVLETLRSEEDIPIPKPLENVTTTDVVRNFIKAKGLYHAVKRVV